MSTPSPISSLRTRRAFTAFESLLDALKAIPQYEPISEDPGDGLTPMPTAARLEFLEEISKCFAKHDLERKGIAESRISAAIEKIYGGVCEILQTLPDSDYQRRTITSRLIKVQDRLRHARADALNENPPTPAPRQEAIKLSEIDEESCFNKPKRNITRRNSLVEQAKIPSEQRRRRSLGGSTSPELGSDQDWERQSSPRKRKNTGQAKNDLRPSVHGIGAKSGQRVNELIKKQKRPTNFEMSKPTASFTKPIGLPSIQDRTYSERYKTSVVQKFPENRSKTPKASQIRSTSPDPYLHNQLSPMDTTRSASRGNRTPGAKPHTQSRESSTGFSDTSSIQATAPSSAGTVSTARSPFINRPDDDSLLRSRKDSRSPSKPKSYLCHKPSHGSPIRRQVSPTPRARKRYPLGEHSPNDPYGPGSRL